MNKSHIARRDPPAGGSPGGATGGKLPAGWLALFAGLFVAGFVAFRLADRDRSEGVSVEATPAPTDSEHATFVPVAADGVRLIDRWRPILHQYAIEYVFEASFVSNGAAPVATSGRVGGSWSVSTVPNDAQPSASTGIVRLMVEFAVSDWRFDAFADRSGATEAELPFVVEVDAATGRVTDFLFDPSVAPSTRGVLRAIASELQLSLPADAGEVAGLPSTWTAVEDDPTGRALASYARVEASDSSKVTIRRERDYTSRHEGGTARDGAATSDTAQTGATGHTILVVRPDAWPDSVRTEVVFTSDDAMAGLSVRTTTTLEARLTDESALDARLGTMLESAASYIRSGVDDRAGLDEIAAASERTSAERRLGGRGTGDVVGSLRALDREASVDAYQAVVLDLDALLRASPSAAAELAGAVRPDDEPFRAGMVYQALSMTDTPEAHGALVDGLSNAALPPGVRAQAAAALASAVRGSREAFDALDAAHRDATQAGETVFGASAGLAMGTQAGQIADPADRAAAVERLRANLTAAQTDESRALWLASLGNTGDPDLFTQLEPFLASASPMVRASTLFALRACNDPRTDGAIATAFASDPDETVRVTAARTLGYRDVVRFSSLLDQALRGDPSAVVRGEVLTLADATPALAALLRPALEYVVRVDASARLRERAAALIESSSSAMPGSP